MGYGVERIRLSTKWWNRHIRLLCWVEKCGEYVREEATNYANELAKSLNISDEQVIVRSDYFVTMERGLINSDMYLYLLIGAITFIGSGIVIYSIFYISVAENNQKLRTTPHDWNHQKAD